MKKTFNTKNKKLVITLTRHAIIKEICLINGKKRCVSDTFLISESKTREIENVLKEFFKTCDKKTEKEIRNFIESHRN
jgi:hypothetical protein